MSIFDEDVYCSTRCIGCIIHSNNFLHHHACTDEDRARSLSPLPYRADLTECAGCRYHSLSQRNHMDPITGCLRGTKNNDLEEKRTLCKFFRDDYIRRDMIQRIQKKRRERCEYRKQNNVPMLSQEPEHSYEVKS